MTARREHDSTSDAPRALVAIAGTVFSCNSFTVALNNYSASDTAECVLTLQGEHQSDNHGNRLSAIDFGSATQTGKPYPIAIYAGFPRDPTPGAYSIKDLFLQFAGIVDTFESDYGQDAVTVSARSYAALFLNSRTTAKWNNLTTVQVVRELAARHGLTTKIALKTSPATMQTVYNRDFVTGTQNMDEWSLLGAMAQVDGAEVFVRGTDLYYRTLLKSGQGPKVDLVWDDNLLSAKVQHSPQFSQLVKVDVKAYSPQTRQSVRSTIQGIAGMAPLPGTQRTGSSVTTHSPVFGTRTSISSGSSQMTINGVPVSSNQSSTVSTTSGGSFSSGFTTMPKGPSALEYTYHVPGLTQAQCDDLARKIWIDLSSHLFHLTAEAAVTPDVQSILNQDLIARLSGPVPSHNLDYNTRRLTQSFEVSQSDEGPSAGWTYTVDGVNVPIVEAKI